MTTPIRPQVYLGSRAPNFTADSSQGQLDFYDYIGDSWCLFFSHPGDFTPVCTTEIGAFAALHEEFKLRNCKLLGLSTNSRETHIRWIKDIHQITGFNVQFPIVCDDDRKICTTFGMIDLRNFDAQGRPQPIRSAYLIDNRKEVRLVHAYPLSTGRNTAEILRCLDSLQCFDKHDKKILTPVNWVPGDDVVVSPDLSPASARTVFPHHRCVRSYLRLTPLDPDI
ncbi:hypothetical protein HG537_0E01090 [Torulaspora globosa]|uniref:Thioredoxin domain-containing protein n=1 Tax=Torulaspora globosa TaxID=48254 RepID=A0A7H9HSP3_9SACH|nr:hypothetical protein HG537_0E01090 [Torulaspora sp. CBS 2947]